MVGPVLARTGMVGSGKSWQVRRGRVSRGMARQVRRGAVRVGKVSHGR